MEKIPIRNISKTTKEPELSGNFSIRDLCKLLDGADMVQELHRHDFFLILTLEKGKGNHEIDFTTYEVCDHSVFFMRPGQVHQLELIAGSSGYLMQFNPSFYYASDKASHHILRKTSNKNLYQLDADGYKKLNSILTFVFQEFSDKQERYQEVIQANLDIFFIELFRQHSTGLSKNVNPYKQERLEDFLELLETHISSIKQVSQYADEMNLSPYQLNSITKATLDKTCSELINEYIVLESKRYLLATSNQVKEIAYHLGYDDVSYFIRFFKKHTGYSPETFRQNFR